MIDVRTDTVETIYSGQIWVQLLLLYLELLKVVVLEDTLIYVVHVCCSYDAFLVHLHVIINRAVSLRLGC